MFVSKEIDLQNEAPSLVRKVSHVKSWGQQINPRNFVLDGDGNINKVMTEVEIEQRSASKMTLVQGAKHIRQCVLD